MSRYLTCIIVAAGMTGAFALAGSCSDDASCDDCGAGNNLAGGGATAGGAGGTGGATSTGGQGGEEPPPPPPAEYSFVVFGDNQFATNSCTSGVPERLAIPEAIRQRAPTFVLHTGDLMDHGSDDGAYAQLTSCYSDMLAELPFFPTPGNHDMGYQGIANYKAYLEQQLFTTNAAVWSGDYAADFTIWYEDDPNEYSHDFDHKTHTDIVPSGVSFETFYAMRYQNAYIVSFEQGTRWWSNTPKSWLQQHLQAARADATIDHIIVTMHHPMYSTNMEESSSGECIEPVRSHYEPYFRDNDVTLVLSGHNHFYDRFYVPDDGSATAQTPPPASYPHDGDAVHYLVTGGGGGPLPASGCSSVPTPKQQYSIDYSQARGCGYHFVEVEVAGAELTVRVFEVEGNATDFTTTQWDEFRIE